MDFDTGSLLTLARHVVQYSRDLLISISSVRITSAPLCPDFFFLLFFFFDMDSGNCIQVLMVAWQARSWWSHLPRPSFCLLQIADPQDTSGRTLEITRI